MSTLMEKPVELKELVDDCCMQFWIAGRTVREAAQRIEEKAQQEQVKALVLRMHLIATIRIQFHTGLISREQRDEIIDYINSLDK